MTQAQVVNLILAAIPRPEHVRDIDFKTAADAVYFTYWNIRFKATVRLGVDEVEGSILRGSTTASFLSQLLKKQDLLNAIKDANNKSASRARG